MKKLIIITTHPIQYYAPVFKLLANFVRLKVLYSGGEVLVNQYDHGFKKKIYWDVDLLEGYDFEFLENVSKKPGSNHFNGIVNPSAITQINNFKPDVILIYGWSYRSHLNIIRHFKGKVPLYFRGDSTLLDEQNSFKEIFKKTLLKWVYQHIDKSFYVGKANKAYFEKYGLKENQLIFAPHSVDNNHFSNAQKDNASMIRKNLNIKTEHILILFAGKLERKKNPELLLQAFIELDLPNVHLLFVGNGELEELLKLRVEGLMEESLKLKVESLNGELSSDQVTEVKKAQVKDDKLDRIHFMDFQNQTKMPAVYQACDLFCLPSQGPGETWGLAVNEAMAAGKAILISDKVGCGADLINQLNGKIFKSNDLDDLKQKLVVLATNKNNLIKMGKVAHEQIQSWSFEKQANIIARYVNG
jgi:glycosyltransferase involved in cell wall biosynthesis